jgi:hypothetical protein
MSKYRYSGPPSGVTLADGSEVMLFPGSDVELPEAHEYTATLVALGHLTLLSETKAKKGDSNGG